MTEQTDLGVSDWLASGGEFPVSSAPYCDLGERFGVAEVDVLARVLELRETGRIARIGASFPEGSAVGFCSTFDEEEMTPAPVAGVEITCDEAELLMLLSDDLPYSERPYAELAAELQMRGIDVDEAWVLGRIRDWLDSRVIVRFGAEIA